MQEEKTQDLLKNRYGPQLEQVFDSYVKFEDAEQDQKPGMASRAMQLKNFMKLLTHFKIVPPLISPGEVSILFKHLLRGKEVDKLDKIRALNFDDFQEALVRIAILVKSKLGIADCSTYDDSIEKKLKIPIKSYDLSGLSVQTIEKLLLYMNLSPGDTKLELEKKIKAIRTEYSHALTLKQLKNIAKSNIMIV